MQELWTIIFGTATGFAAAGLVASVYDLLLNRRLRFAFENGGGAPELMLGLLVRLVAGPFLLVRKAYESVRDDMPNPVLLAALIAVACTWGCLSGVILLDLMGGLTPNAAAAR